MKIFYGKGAYKRTTLPELRLVNMHVEQSVVSEDAVILQSEQGLAEYSDIGSGPVRGVFQQDGLFGDDEFAVSGRSVYRGTTLLGNILGDGPVSFAASATELAINAGGPIYRYDGTVFEAVSFPDTADVCKVLFHDGQFIALRVGDDKFYTSGVLDASDWDALSFKAAESEPDFLLDAETLTDMLYLFGQSSIEVWVNDGSGDTVPYTRQELSTIEKGVRDTGSVVSMDQALFFVSNENMAMTIRGGVPERVSHHGIEEQIAASETVACFGYISQGHSFFCVRLDDKTYRLDVATKEWSEAATTGLDNYLAQCATRPGGAPIFGSSQDGKLYTFGGWMHGSYPMARIFTAGIPISGGTVQIDALSVNASVGHTSSLSGLASSPVLEMCSSRDGGATFGTSRSVSLGEQGHYRNRVRYRRCGMFDEPGALIEFRCTDPVDFRISGVFVNEPGGGRSRG